MKLNFKFFPGILLKVPLTAALSVFIDVVDGLPVFSHVAKATRIDESASPPIP